MAKFYESDEFKVLNAEWREKLRKAKFKDHERPNGSMIEHNRRTQAWQDRDLILENILRLESYLNHHVTEIDPKYQTVLQLYVNGEKINVISRATGFHRNWVRQIIQRYCAFCSL